jgi:uncharacterized membrane protein
MASTESEKFDARDVAQTAVGSLAGALIYAYQTDIPRLADSLPNSNTVLIVLITILLSFFIGYRIGIRRLGKRKMKFLFGLLPLRLTVHYAFALFFSASMLFILGINSFGTPFDLALRRIVVLSLPATLLGSTIDLVESQKD